MSRSPTRLSITVNYDGSEPQDYYLIRGGRRNLANCAHEHKLDSFYILLKIFLDLGWSLKGIRIPGGAASKPFDRHWRLYPQLISLVGMPVFGYPYHETVMFQCLNLSAIKNCLHRYQEDDSSSVFIRLVVFGLPEYRIFGPFFCPNVSVARIFLSVY